MAILPQEKRQFPRLNVKEEMRLQVRGLPSFNNAVTEDISAGGLGFINNEYIAPNTTLSLEVNVLSRILHSFGRVAWASPLPHNDRYRVGVEFAEMDPRERNFLRDYINLRAGSLNGLA